MPSQQFVTTGVESLARRIALAGLASRAEAERAIAQGQVIVDGRTQNISRKVPDTSSVVYNGVEVPPPPLVPHLFGLVKPRGYLSEFSRIDGDERKNYISDLLLSWDIKGSREFGTKSLEKPESLRHYIIINRIPSICHGLLLLTTDGLFAESLRQTDSKILTTYRVRVGNLVDSQIDDIRRWKGGIGVSGIDYGPVFIDVEKRTPTQTWLKVRLVDAPGRNVADLFWYRAKVHVNRLNCFAFGPYKMSDVPERQVLQLPIHESIHHLVPRREIKPLLVPVS
jgi:16S rRNA U516 pseudouridylate synthase RsuA-like enzyme